jgi:hypothetical protein
LHEQAELAELAAGELLFAGQAEHGQSAKSAPCIILVTTASFDATLKYSSTRNSPAMSALRYASLDHQDLPEYVCNTVLSEIRPVQIFLKT